MPDEANVPNPPRIDGVKPVKKVLASGKVVFYLYHRATGRRLPDDPASPAFALALAANNRDAAAEAAPPPESGTVTTLIAAYQHSPDWTRLAPYTREIEQFHINAVEAEFGDMPLAAVERKGARAMFLEWRDDVAEDRPAAADARLARFARILKFGLDREIIERHPLASFKRVYRVDRSEVLWLPDHFKALNDSKASVSIKFAAFLALHSGQRRGDIIALRWRQYDGAGISLIQSKTKKLGSAGRRIYTPATRALKTALDALRARIAENGGRDIGELHILTAARGDAYTANAFRLAWEHAFAASGIKPVVVDEKTFDLHFHDIRGTSVTMLAEAGCTAPEIASITGHSFASATRILETYLSATRALATSAIAKLDSRIATMSAEKTYHILMNL